MSGEASIMLWLALGNKPCSQRTLAARLLSKIRCYYAVLASRLLRILSEETHACVNSCGQLTPQHLPKELACYFHLFWAKADRIANCSSSVAWLLSLRSLRSLLVKFRQQNIVKCNVFAMFFPVPKSRGSPTSRIFEQHLSWSSHPFTTKVNFNLRTCSKFSKRGRDAVCWEMWGVRITEETTICTPLN